MKLISEYRSNDGEKTAEVRFSLNKQIYYAKLSSGHMREFYTCDEAEDWCEDWVQDTAVYDSEGQLIENKDKTIDSGSVELFRPNSGE